MTMLAIALGVFGGMRLFRALDLVPALILRFLSSVSKFCVGLSLIAIMIFASASTSILLLSMFLVVWSLAQIGRVTEP